MQRFTPQMLPMQAFPGAAAMNRLQPSIRTALLPPLHPAPPISLQQRPKAALPTAVPLRLLIPPLLMRQSAMHLTFRAVHSFSRTIPLIHGRLTAKPLRAERLQNQLSTAWRELQQASGSMPEHFMQATGSVLTGWQAARAALGLCCIHCQRKC